MAHVDIYTDGSCKGNGLAGGGRGGWAAILSCNGKTKELSGAEPNTTNNRMELLAVISGLEALTKECTVRVHLIPNTCGMVLLSGLMAGSGTAGRRKTSSPSKTKTSGSDSMRWFRGTRLNGIGLEVTPEISATNAPTRSRGLQLIPCPRNSQKFMGHGTCDLWVMSRTGRS